MISETIPAKRFIKIQKTKYGLGKIMKKIESYKGKTVIEVEKMLNLLIYNFIV